MKPDNCAARHRLTRRQCLRRFSLAGPGLAVPGCRSPSRRSAAPAGGGDERRPQKKAVAAILTRYYKGSHADALVGKILEGWAYDGGAGPRLRLASLYVDQFPADDMARAMAEKHGITIYPTIEDALTLKSNRLAVDGVLSIGEQGDYPWNEKEQQLFPRRRFFAGIANTFEKYGEVVPVFNDKHLGPVWEDALWMYRRARQLGIPFMAGSSLPVSYRKPDVAVPPGSRIDSAVGIGYSGLDVYGSHALEVYQAFVERRRGGESGVRSVQWFDEKHMGTLIDSGAIDREVFDAALAVTPKSEPGRNIGKPKGKETGVFFFEYRDGLSGAVFMLPGRVAGCGIAVKVRGRDRPVATTVEERREPHYPHFAYLLKAVETMMLTGKPAYPVERTLLVSGILDRALTSRFEGGEKLVTPELAIGYRPADYPHAPRPVLTEPYRSEPVSTSGLREKFRRRGIGERCVQTSRVTHLTN